MRDDSPFPRPVLVIISGPPGAGKSSIAEEISRTLGLALFSKDMFKEGIYDHLPGTDTSDAHRLGIASVRLMYAFAQRQLENGVGIILESTFDRGKAEADVQPLLDLSRAVIVHCTAPPDLLLERYKERAGSTDRHEVHQDESRVDDLEKNLREGTYDPMDVGVPVIEVDMTDPKAVDVRGVIVRIRTILGDRAVETSASRQ